MIMIIESFTQRICSKALNNLGTKQVAVQLYIYYIICLIRLDFIQFPLFSLHDTYKTKQAHLLYYLNGHINYNNLHLLYLNVTLDHKTSLKLHGYICSNSQQYINLNHFSFMPKIMRIFSKDHVP